jgi:hypothetical protein
MPVVFLFKGTNMFNHSLEERVKRLEEELCYCHKDIAHLCSIIENLQEPEIHFHYYSDFRTCKVCDQNNSTDLKDFI